MFRHSKTKRPMSLQAQIEIEKNELPKVVMAANPYLLFSLENRNREKYEAVNEGKENGKEQLRYVTRNLNIQFQTMSGEDVKMESIIPSEELKYLLTSSEQVRSSISKEEFKKYHQPLDPYFTSFLGNEVTAENTEMDMDAETLELKPQQPQF